jgi:3-methyl-2-oxobutanoate hydroxymethyltransferase
MKNTTVTFRQMKQKGEKISMLTAYDYSTAKLVDSAGINGILVGDSLGNVMLGYPDTVSVTMEDMIHHSAAVARGAENSLVVTDMPFMSYQASVYDAVMNAGRLMKEGRAQAVKLEGGRKVAEQIKAIVNADIPVMAHIGLTPQSINAFGGYKAQGRDIESAKKLVDDAYAVQEAGAFSVVLECVPAELATYVTEKLDIPTIGIGGGAGTDGQILVYADMIAMFSDYKPKFVKHFANVGQIIREGFASYDAEVKAGSYPAEEHNYAIAPEVMNEVRSTFG